MKDRGRRGEVPDKRGVLQFQDARPPLPGAQGMGRCLALAMRYCPGDGCPKGDMVEAGSFMETSAFMERRNGRIEEMPLWSGSGLGAVAKFVRQLQAVRDFFRAEAFYSDPYGERRAVRNQRGRNPGSPGQSRGTRRSGPPSAASGPPTLPSDLSPWLITSHRIAKWPHTPRRTLRLPAAPDSGRGERSGTDTRSALRNPGS